MRGAVAAGNRHSADAGAWALREGGTAVDAAVAATLAAFVTEGPLTGPAGGGFALLHEPGHATTLLDCFFAVPTRDAGEMEEVEIDFVGSSTQVFHVGESSVAVPRLVARLVEAQARRGRLPWERLFLPALELAGRVQAAHPGQVFSPEILPAILPRDPGGGGGLQLLRPPLNCKRTWGRPLGPLLAGAGPKTVHGPPCRILRKN